MSTTELEKKIAGILATADIQINGSRPWDPQIHNRNFYNRVLSQGSLGIGESYMDGWWDCKEIDQLVFKALRGGLDKKFRGALNIKIIWHVLRAILFNLQTRSRAYEVAEVHYDIGNDLYEKMLGPTMSYTCAYWKNAKNLEEAENAKFDLVCRKLGLKKGQHILDVGCGFGTFAEYAAKNYGVSVVAVTIAKEQALYAKERVKNLPIEVRCEDYRQISGTFDHIISIGLMEHIGYKNYRPFMKQMQGMLKDGGYFLVHFIGQNKSRVVNDPWLNKYIFPNAMAPSAKQIATAIEGLFILEDWHTLPATDYYKTLMAWHHNFVKNWPTLKDHYGGERFYRMWTYGLLSGAGAHLSGTKVALWQIVLSKSGTPSGYESVR